jgi:hypothetical protein
VLIIERELLTNGIHGDPLTEGHILSELVEIGEDTHKIVIGYYFLVLVIIEDNLNNAILACRSQVTILEEVEPLLVDDTLI